MTKGDAKTLDKAAKQTGLDRSKLVRWVLRLGMTQLRYLISKREE